jgi:hypothetical protein
MSAELGLTYASKESRYMYLRIFPFLTTMLKILEQFQVFGGNFTILLLSFSFSKNAFFPIVVKSKLSVSEKHKTLYMYHLYQQYTFTIDYNFDEEDR